MNVTALLDHPLSAAHTEARMNQLAQKLLSHALWQLQFTSGSHLWFHVRTEEGGIIWNGTPKQVNSLVEARDLVQREGITVNDTRWRLPTPEELLAFAKLPTNPLRTGKNNRLLDRDYVYASTTLCDLDGDSVASIKTSGDRVAIVFMVADFNMTNSDVVNAFAKRLKYLFPAKKTVADDIWQPFLLSCSTSAWLSDLDWRATRLPRLDASEFEDRNKGLWEFFGEDEAQLEEMGVIARNPVLDIRDRSIAIDFGTSSTVIAYEDNGVKKLLRIGVQNYLEEPKPGHFENPTVLQFIDLERLLVAWNETAYRPAVQWEDVCSSHEALMQFRRNETDPSVVASILPKIKQWALRQSQDHRTRITDKPVRTERAPMEYELTPLTLNSPVKGAALAVSKDDPLDPVELYAWFLGMIINWRKFGLHLRYYMTFPVEYPRDVREKILASFKRGLQRSLPEPLVRLPEFDKFEVKELASEPAAYAAAALKALNVQPTTKGITYAVFDFGGGTTDFDFGCYRQPDEDEEDLGYEQVFEQFSTGGDRFLGGENLLENMAYRVFRDNLDQCREKHIVFTKPLDAEDFPGWEPFLDQSQAAQTNTLILMSLLRPLWEGTEFDNAQGVLPVQLLDRAGEKVACHLTLNDQALHGYLQQRIGKGIYNFCAAMQKAFRHNVPESVTVLLAGNASRSKWVLAHFGLLEHAGNPDDESVNSLLWGQTEAWLQELFGDEVPLLLPCPPLLAQEDQPYAPTAKTGVALGLLDLCPEGYTKVVNHSMPDADSEAAFAHYVGRIRKGLFTPGLQHGAPYLQWFELGPQREKVFKLWHTNAPEAHTGMMREDSSMLIGKRIDLSGVEATDKVYGRAIAPDTVEICSAASVDAVDAGQFANLQTIKLAN